MASFALVSGGIIIELSPEVFPVNPAFVWTGDISGVSPAPQPGWTYNGTTFAAPVAPVVDMRPAAQAALDRSDITIIRCYEHAVAVPAVWGTYRTALRAIVAGGATSAALPVQPAYPAGT